PEHNDGQRSGDVAKGHSISANTKTNDRKPKAANSTRSNSNKPSANQPTRSGSAGQNRPRRAKKIAAS
ncbi:hypothetical protein B9J93_09345, partial [Vibrio sp. V17_P4S1T151]